MSEASSRASVRSVKKPLDAFSIYSDLLNILVSRSLRHESELPRAPFEYTVILKARLSTSHLAVCSVSE